mmetsp:Transcript_11167/g.30019  ORF Transcript_11167/g.30019 Transcript_11167/m.30019 type:complete len:224 (-) Transcript_11167:662-1333(-)
MLRSPDCPNDAPHVSHINRTLLCTCDMCLMSDPFCVKEDSHSVQFQLFFAPPLPLDFKDPKLSALVCVRSVALALMFVALQAATLEPLSSGTFLVALLARALSSTSKKARVFSSARLASSQPSSACSFLVWRASSSGVANFARHKQHVLPIFSDERTAILRRRFSSPVDMSPAGICPVRASSTFAVADTSPRTSFRLPSSMPGVADALIEPQSAPWLAIELSC